MPFDEKTLLKYDKSRMHEFYNDWPEIAKNAFSSELKKLPYKKINHIVFCGMGGSGTIGDTLSAILSKSNIHISLVKGYVLPNTVSKNSLVIVTSVSGNTMESYNVLKQAYLKKSNLVVYSSGGVLEKFCYKKNIFYQKIPQIHSPRTSFPLYLYSILNSLEKIIPLSRNDITESISSLKKISKNISSDNMTNSNKSLLIAKFIKGIPAIYYPSGLQASAIRFKNSLQENSKTHAFSEDVMEASHNGIVSWEKKSNVQPILIQGKDDHPKTKQRWKIFEEYFDQKDITYYKVPSVNGNILSKIISLIYQLDYSTVYLATIKKIDPSPVRSIDFIKSRIT